MIIIGTFGKSRKIGHLVHGQLVQRLAEIIQSSSGHPIGIEAEKNLVQIEFENLILAEGLLDALGQQGLLQLALRGLLARQKKVLGDLLGNGGGADELSAAAAQPGLNIGDDGAGDALPVEAGVAVKILVLGRQKRGDQLAGNGVHRDEQPALLCIFGDERPVSGMHARHDRRLVKCQLIIIREVFLGLPNDVARSHGEAAEDDETGPEQEAQESQHAVRLPCRGPCPIVHFCPPHG